MSHESFRPLLGAGPIPIKSDAEKLIVEQDDAVTVVAVDSGDTRLVVEEDGEITIIAVAEQGPTGPRGQQGVGAEESEYTAGVSLVSGRAVRFNELGQLIYADAGTPEHAVGTVGVTTVDALAGTLAAIKQVGHIDSENWGWTVGAPIYVGASGALTQTPPTAPGSAFSQQIGFAVTPTRMFVSIQLSISLS